MSVSDLYSFGRRRRNGEGDGPADEDAASRSNFSTKKIR